MLAGRLIREAKAGNLKVVEQLLAAGLDVDVTDRFGVTALMAAALWSRPDVAKYLLDHGADTEIRERYFGCTALIFACLSGTADVLKLLLENGADPNAMDATGRTPLMAASSMNNVEAMRLLLKFRAHVHVANKYGWKKAKVCQG